MKNRQFSNRLLWCVFLWFCGVCVASMQAQSGEARHKHGDWFWGVGAGFSQSLAENAKGTDFIVRQLPSVNMLLGHNFSPNVGIKVTGGLNMQTSRCSDALVNSIHGVYGDGRYNFRCLTGSVSGIINLTNIFWGYEVERPVTWGLVFGAGVMRTFSFDKKLEAWNVTPKASRPYYPVNNANATYIVGHAGITCDVRLNEPWDIGVDLRINATDNDYNGVSNGNHLDFYVDLMCNLVYHFKNGKQQLRRFREPQHVAFVDPVLVDHTSEYKETVRYGESMQTQIPFYSGFSYLNTATTKRLQYVARFLQSHPNVNLNIVGHPDVTADVNLKFHEDLARKRAEIVRETLVENFHVSAHRLRISYDDRAMQPFKTVREWVPAVNFVMEEPTEEPQP